jgi:hypothetical protein
MSALLILIIIIILMLTVVFLAPISLSLNLLKKGPLVQGSYRLGWLGITLYRGEISPLPSGDIAGLEMAGPQSEEAHREKTGPMEEGADGKRPEGKKSRKKEKQPPMPAPGTKELIEAMPALVRVFVDFIRSIDLKTICCRVSFGLDDPADTAIIIGYIWSAAYSIGLYRANICIEPYFEGERLDGSFLASVKARLLWMVLVAVRALGEEKIRKLVIETARRGTA